jgi:TonB family protein
MMTNKTSKSSHLLKLLALLPIVGTALALNAETVTDYVYKNDEPQKQVPVKKGKANATIRTGNNQTIQVVATDIQKTEKQEVKEEASAKPNDERAFDNVEEMPQFPGGMQALMEFLSKNIRYPKEAFEANKQGRVIANFVIEKDGSISEAKVVKSVDPALDEEAVRVINAMPNWMPGRQSGKAVRVKYTVPINFRLDGSKPKDNNVANVMQAAASGNIFLTTNDPVKTPLIIVDGKEVPYENLKTIVHDDVESINVLKDKAAVTMYGEKGKDGVIVITTKK